MFWVFVSLGIPVDRRSHSTCSLFVIQNPAPNAEYLVCLLPLKYSAVRVVMFSFLTPWLYWYLLVMGTLIVVIHYGMRLCASLSTQRTISGAINGFGCGCIAWGVGWHIIMSCDECMQLRFR